MHFPSFDFWWLVFITQTKEHDGGPKNRYVSQGWLENVLQLRSTLLYGVLAYNRPGG